MNRLLALEEKLAAHIVEIEKLLDEIDAQMKADRKRAADELNKTVDYAERIVAEAKTRRAKQTQAALDQRAKMLAKYYTASCDSASTRRSTESLAMLAARQMADENGEAVKVFLHTPGDFMTIAVVWPTDSWANEIARWDE